MRGLIWFLPDFRDWPLALTRALQARHPDWSFCGIVTGFDYDHAHVKAAAPDVRPLHFMDGLQREWLSRPAEPGRLAEYERLLGAQALNRILIADRNVGRGFIAGVDMPQTPLMRMTRGHEGRTRYLVGLLDFLFELFETEKPDFVFAPGVAGGLAMALAVVCRHFGVAFRALLSTRIGTRHTITDAPGGLSPIIERRFEAACGDPSAVAPWIDEARAFLAAFHDRPHKSRDTETSWQRAARPLRPVDMAALGWRTVTGRAPALVNLPYPHAYFAWEVRRRLRIRRMARSPLFRPASALEGRRFVYFPLHRTPEASTMVLAPMLTDQIPVIEALAKCLPAGTLLAVKEHVPMVGRRHMDFYRRLAAIPKVVLISPFADTYELIRGADLTCVITGTAGWEAVLMKRPVLCLGPALYQTVGEGFVRCDELARLPEAIPEAVDVAPARDERIALYVASVMAESFELPKKLRFLAPAELVAAHPEISEAMTDYLLLTLDGARPEAAGRTREPRIA